MWKYNCFLTLTYDEEHKPKNGHLQPEDLQLFIKRLRSAVHRNADKYLSAGAGGVRYLACGEYGERTWRPHYHLLVFNLGFKYVYESGKGLYESYDLAKIWPQGRHKIGTVTGASANYVAQYTLKKIGRTHYDQDGVIYPAPFLRVSRKPPIGQKWLTKYKNDLRNGYLVTNGIKGRVPRAYKKMLENMGETQLLAEINYNASRYPRGEHNLEAAETIHASRAAQAQTRSL